jgi:hypothetical protein
MATTRAEPIRYDHSSLAYSRSSGEGVTCFSSAAKLWGIYIHVRHLQDALSPLNHSTTQAATGQLDCL